MLCQDVWRVISFLPRVSCQLLYGLFEWILPEKWIAKDVSKDIVLITGAGAGLGRNMAIQYAKQGSSLVLWDINEEALNETKILVEQMHFSIDKERRKNKEKKSQNDENKNEHSRKISNRIVLTYKVDMNDKLAIQKTAKQVRQDLNANSSLLVKTLDTLSGTESKYVSVLVNNAGIYYGSLLLELSDEQIERIFNINIISHFWTIREFLPTMIENRRGHVVEIASIAGINGFHKQVDYSATKFATVGLEEALSFELEYLGVSSYIKTTVVCPFYFKSELFTNYSHKALSLMDARYVAERAVMAMRCNFTRIILPPRLGYLICILRDIITRSALISCSKALNLPECVKGIKGTYK